MYESRIGAEAVGFPGPHLYGGNPTTTEMDECQTKARTTVGPFWAHGQTESDPQARPDVPTFGGQ